MWSWPWGSSTDEAREGGFKLGEVVEYYSASQGAWIPAKVVAVKPNSYDLDCKPDVPPARIRSCASARDSRVSSSGLLEFEPGDVVEYFSISQNDWILAKVLSINASGTYNLDCKPEVPPERVRAQRGSDLVISPVSVSKPRSLRQAGTIFDLCQVQDLDEPIQLLRLQKASQRWRYELCPEGLRALEAYGGRKIAVVSVCGPSNSGKSYLLNVLLGRVEESLPAFKVGTRRTGSCTDGLWLWAHRDPDDENAPILAYLDCAGFGVSDRSCDGQLMTLCALMSSVMILNTKGTLGEAVFNSLACVTRLAEHLQERGQDVSRPALLWVLRDFTLDLRDAAGSLMSPEEYLEQALHAANPGTEEVRKSLLRFFNHRSCTTLVQPVFEEAQLKSLPEKPYKSLRSEFRAAVEAVQAQLIATCHLHPKTVAGQVLGASSYAALLKQLVEAMDEQKPLNVRNAWDTVQHTSCGSLADELRGIATQKLKLLKSGQKLPDDTQLPLTDDALRSFFRRQRHGLKERWEEQAVGDEEVRKEYWQELKETLAREEIQVRQQNGRLADQQLSEALKPWQAWLDSPEGAVEEGEKISIDLGKLLDRLPSTAVTRGGRSAIEAAARSVAVARTAVSATVEQSAEAQRRALAWGEQAAKLEGAVRSELEATKASIKESMERFRAASQEKEAKTVELQGKGAELEDGLQQLSAIQADVEEAKVREAELKASVKSNEERNFSLQHDLEATRALAAKTTAEHLASQRSNEAAAEVLQTLAFATPLAERLFPSFHGLMRNRSTEAIFQALQPPSLANAEAIRLRVFCCVYAVQLQPMYDYEFFGEANPLRLEEVKELLPFLNRLAYHFVTAMPDQASLLPAAKALRTSLTSLINLLYHRHQRRPILDSDHDWILPESRTLLRRAPSALNLGTALGVPETEEAEDEPEAMEVDESGEMGEFPEARCVGSSATSSVALAEKALQAVLAEMPHVLPFEDRVSILHNAILADQDQRRAFRGPWGLSTLDKRQIRRNHLVDDGIAAFEGLDEAALRDTFRVEFVAPDGTLESGVDGGGLFKEFMIHICREMFDPEFGLFRATESHSLYPSSEAFTQFPQAADLYIFLGKVVGKAIYEMILLEPQFSRVFLNRVLGRINEVDDIASLDKELHRNMLQIKECPDVEALGITFSISVTEKGMHKDINLIPNGSNTPVTRENLTRYLHLMANYRTNIQFQRHTAAFLSGLQKVIPVTWLKMFDPYELNTLVSGDLRETGFDVADLRANTVLSGGYEEDSPCVRWLWRLLQEELGAEDLGRFLMFVTSCSRAPLLGFKNLNPKFCVHRVPDGERLPTSATCANLLKLPDYTSYQSLKTKVLQAIRAEAGFDLS